MYSYCEPELDDIYIYLKKQKNKKKQNKKEEKRTVVEMLVGGV